MHSSLFFRGLSAVSNTIILLKYFNLKLYYSTIKSVIPLPDIHRDTAFCPFPNAMAALLPHCKLQQTSTFTVFHHHSTFSQSFLFLLYLFHSFPFPPLLPFHLGPCRWERTKRDSKFSIQGRSCPVTDYIDASLGAVRPSTAHKLGLQLQDGGRPTASGWLGASAGQAGSNPLQTAWRHHLGSDPARRRPGITCTTATVSSNWLGKNKKNNKKKRILADAGAHGLAEASITAPIQSQMITPQCNTRNLALSLSASSWHRIRMWQGVQM